MSELIIRPGHNDHEVIADLLSPGGASPFAAPVRPPISRLVLDAPTAAKRPKFAEVAGRVGVPVVIDPLTPLMQGAPRPEDSWAQLPFGVASAVTSSELDPQNLRHLVERSTEFQRSSGASLIVPPYFYASGPEDPWFKLSLDAVLMTRDLLTEEGSRLPILPILCGQLAAFGDSGSWKDGLDAAISTLGAADVSQVGLCLSPMTALDSFNKVMRLFESALHVRESGLKVLAWRQGVYGPGLVAAGLDGYETGIGTREFCNIPRMTASRKPKPGSDKKSGGAAPGVYIELFGRSVTAPIAGVLFGDIRMRARVMCSDDNCCPHGPASTLDHAREHAVRSRARSLEALDAVPHPGWKLHKVANDAKQAVVLAAQANKLLKSVGLPEAMKSKWVDALAKTAEQLRDRYSGSNVA